MRLHRTARPGVSLVQFAIVAPLATMLTLGLLVGAMGVFRNQQMAAIAREASRWASMHGTDYAKATGLPAATAQDIYNQVIVPRSTALNLGYLSYTVTWNTDNRPYHTVVVNSEVTAVANTVTVTINYQWVSEAYFGTVNLTSTSATPMSF